MTTSTTAYYPTRDQVTMQSWRILVSDAPRGVSHVRPTNGQRGVLCGRSAAGMTKPPQVAPYATIEVITCPGCAAAARTILEG